MLYQGLGKHAFDPVMVLYEYLKGRRSPATWEEEGNRVVDRFHGCGLARVCAETGLLTLAQNLRRLDNLQRIHANLSEPTT